MKRTTAACFRQSLRQDLVQEELLVVLIGIREHGIITVPFSDDLPQGDFLFFVTVVFLSVLEQDIEGIPLWHSDDLAFRIRDRDGGIVVHDKHLKYSSVTYRQSSHYYHLLKTLLFDLPYHEVLLIKKYHIFFNLL